MYPLTLKLNKNIIKIPYNAIVYTISIQYSLSAVDRHGHQNRDRKSIKIDITNNIFNLI